MSISVTEPRKGVISSRINGTGSGELPSTGAENQIQILCKSSTHSTPESLSACMCMYQCVCVCARACTYTHTHSVKYTYFSISGSSKTLEELFRDFYKIMFIKLANVSNFQSWSLLPSLHTHIALHHYPRVWSYHTTKRVGAELKVLQVHTASSTIANILLYVTLKTSHKMLINDQPFCWYYLPLNSSPGKILMENYNPWSSGFQLWELPPLAGQGKKKKTNNCIQQCADSLDCRNTEETVLA